MKSAKRKGNRIEDVEIMEAPYTLDRAIDEASRCLLCYDPPCSRDCPAGTDPGVFIRKLRLRNIKGAIRTIKDNNIFGGVCGVVCPTERLCEKGCGAALVGRPIEIGRLQRFLVEYGWDIGFDPFERETPRQGKVAVIGSGPAGLSCAAELAKRGFDVTVFEERERPGGVLRYGVPEFRLNEEFLNREIEDITGLGVRIQCNFRIGNRDVDALLKEGCAAVFLGTGLWNPLRLQIPGSDLKNTLTASDLLLRMRQGGRAEIEGMVRDRNVVIIGGGSVAMDVANTCKGLGSRRVYCICLEGFEEIPAAKADLDAARGNFVAIRTNSEVTEILGKDGRVAGVRGREVEWVEPGLFIPSNARPIPGTEFSLRADVVVMAIGSGPTPETAEIFPGLARKGGLLIETGEDGVSTADRRVFAGGDIVRGSSLVVHAVADGKEAGARIADLLTGDEGGDKKGFAGKVLNRDIDLSIEMCGISFPTPFLLSSSPVSNTAEMIGRAFDSGFGGVSYKTIGLDRIKIIHPSPRMAGYDYGDKRLVGLQNVEQITDRPLKDNLRDIRHLKEEWPQHVVIASIMGFSNEEWGELASLCEDSGADMLELNFSCPHMTVEGSGMKVGQAMHLIEQFTGTVKRAVDIPVLAKMTPNITDITEPVLAAKRGGADGITAINTVRAITGFDLDQFTPLPNVAGKGAISGFSGPAVKPIGLRFIAEIAKCPEIDLPLAGCGGIETWVDALEYLLCGARVVQLTTGVIHYGHRLAEDLCEGLHYFMKEKGFRKVSEIVGKGLPNIQNTDAFDLTKQGVAEYHLDRCTGCGQCYIVCRDAGGQCIEWSGEERRPLQDQERCLGCMICSFVCPVYNPPVITFKYVEGKKQVIPPVSG